MEPTLAPGDRLIGWRWARPRPGSIVVVDAPSGMAVKRVIGVDAMGRLDLRGDNPAASTDSRHFGPLPRSAHRGRLVYRYHPPDRAGPLT